MLHRDKKIDLAVVKIDATVPWLKMGDSDKIAHGDWVVVMGNPFNLEYSTSFGIVSHPKRFLTKFGVKSGTHYIQTDAPINPGNSVGMDQHGRVIGINSLGMSNADGIGFAIPINPVRRIVNGWTGLSLRVSDQCWANPVTANPVGAKR